MESDAPLIPWKWITGTLLGGAAAGAVVSAADASIVGRMAGVFAAALLVFVGINVVRGQVWAYGAALMLGVCWFWAVIALRAAGSLQPAEIILWLAWSIVVIVGSVRSRTRPPLGEPGSSGGPGS